MASSEDHKHITTVLIPELLSNFNRWGREYQQERDLGIRGEFVGLYRKTRKLKTLFWDSDYPAADRGWREGPRTIIMEVVAHGLLMLVDWDKAHPPTEPKTLGEESEEESAANAVAAEYADCVRCSRERGHTYGRNCAKKGVPENEREEDDWDENEEGLA